MGDNAGRDAFGCTGIEEARTSSIPGPMVRRARLGEKAYPYQ